MKKASIAIVAIVIVVGSIWFFGFRSSELSFVLHGTKHPLSFPECTVAGEGYTLVGPRVTIKDDDGATLYSDYSKDMDNCRFRVTADVPSSDFYTVEVEGKTIGTYPEKDLRDGDIYD